MDPLTQVSLGAAAGAALSRRPELRRALLVGAVAGGLPDLDVLIRSETDPLLALEFHRHFTHALLAAPIIGLIAAGLVRALFFWKDWSFRRLAIFGMGGALTHGLIDTCTSYGTLLYWPLSHHRESWDVISIIDPLFTLPLGLLLIVAFCARSPRAARAGLLLCTLYLGLGFSQRGAATEWAEQLAEQRGHQAEALTVRPSFGNIVLWRCLYRWGDHYYIDAVRLLPGRSPIHYPGQRVDSFTPERAAKILGQGTVLAEDVERFRFFAQGYLQLHPTEPDVVGDARYATHADGAVPLWGVRMNPHSPDAHVRFEYFREANRAALQRHWRMIRGLPLREPPHGGANFVP
jgi:inner membrane protein